MPTTGTGSAFLEPYTHGWRHGHTHSPLSPPPSFLFFSYVVPLSLTAGRSVHGWAICSPCSDTARVCPVWARRVFLRLDASISAGIEELGGRAYRSCFSKVLLPSTPASGVWELLPRANTWCLKSSIQPSWCAERCPRQGWGLLFLSPPFSFRAKVSSWL